VSGTHKTKNKTERTMPMQNLQHIIWNIDGVLVDSFETDLNVYAEIARQTNKEFNRGLAKSLMRENKSFGEILDILRNLKHAANLQIESDRFSMTSKQPEFFNKYRLFGGIKTLLVKLLPYIAIQSAATMRNHETARKILTQNKIISFFNHIYGTGMLDISNDKTSMLQALLNANPEINLSHTIFITDSPSDIAISHKLSLPVIGVGYGFSDIEHIINAEPTLVVNSVFQLDDLLIHLL
jgi:phosphoglycolate phosphatase-like HAD superfamily hydrolase